MRCALAVMLAACALAGCGDGPPDGSRCKDAAAIPVGTAVVATFVTSHGDIVADLYPEHAPRTVANFVCLARLGFYDGTKFHKALDNQYLEGGDPHSRDSKVSNDGTGGPGYTIPDELHRLLRHQGRGVLGMASDGPDRLGSRFYITVGTVADRDDRFTVFGRARMASWPVIDEIDAEAGTSALNEGRPRLDVRLRDVRIETSGGPPAGPGGLEAWAPDPENAVGPDGGRSSFAVVILSESDHRTDVLVTATATGGTATVEAADRSFVLAARQGRVVIVHADVDAGSGPAQVTLRAASARGNTQATLDVVRDAEAGEPTMAAGYRALTAQTILAEDGRLVETSHAGAAQWAEGNGMFYSGSSLRTASSYRPMPFAPPPVTMRGYAELAYGTPNGHTSAGHVEPADANTQPSHVLYGRPLAMQVDVLDVH